MIYADIVRKSLRELAVNNLTNRRVLYDRLKAALKGVLDGQEPPLEARDSVIEIRLLETTIRRFEADLRAGVDVMSDAYIPEGLEEEQARLYALKVISRPTGLVELQKSDGIDEDLTTSLGIQMRQLSLGAAAEGHWEAPLRIATLRAVVVRILREMSSAQGRLGLFWVVGEPIILIAMMIAVYVFLGQHSVMNMSIVPFAICGIVPWLMIRVTAVRVAGSFLSGRDLLALPPIRIASIAVSHATAQLLIYSLVMVAAIWVTVWLGHGAYPDNWVRVAVVWIGLWAFGLATGVSIAVLFLYWSAAPRMVLMATRFAGWFSGIVYVSEQFPTELKGYILWNPILHGLQLLRSAYFLEYESDDASATFFLFSLGIMVVIAAACEKMIAPKVEPA